MAADDDRRMRLADLARFCIQIIPTELSNRVTADDGIELAKDLRLLAARVDAVISAYGDYAERKIGGIDESLFKNQLLDALEGNALYQIESGAKEREAEDAEPDPDEMRERMREN